MKTQVFVLVPYDVPPGEISAYVERVLEPHRFDPDAARGGGHFDYLIGALEKSFNDPAAERRLPPRIRRAFAGNICDRANLPEDLIPAALVAMDGAWHDFGWRMIDEPSEANTAALARWSAHYRALMGACTHGWVVEVWAHS